MRLQVSLRNCPPLESKDHQAGDQDQGSDG
jgi:hypothetical protein